MINKEKSRTQQWGEQLHKQTRRLLASRIKALTDFAGSFYPVTIRMRQQPLKLLYIKYPVRTGAPPVVIVNISPRLHVSVFLTMQNNRIQTYFLCHRQYRTLYSLKYQMQVPSEYKLIEKILNNKPIFNRVGVSKRRSGIPHNVLLKKDFISPYIITGEGLILKSIEVSTVSIQARKNQIGSFTRKYISQVNNVFFFSNSHPDRLKQKIVCNDTIHTLLVTAHPGTSRSVFEKNLKWNQLHTHFYLDRLSDIFNHVWLNLADADSRLTQVRFREDKTRFFLTGAYPSITRSVFNKNTKWERLRTRLYLHWRRDMLKHAWSGPVAANERLVQARFSKGNVRFILPEVNSTKAPLLLNRILEPQHVLSPFYRLSRPGISYTARRAERMEILHKKFYRDSGNFTDGLSNSSIGYRKHQSDLNSTLELVTKKTNKIETSIDVKKIEETMVRNLSRHLDQTINQRMDKRLASDSKDTLQLTENIYSRLLNRIVLEKERLIF